MAVIEAARLQAGVDYPADLSQFDEFFPDEAACVRYLEGVRWREGFVCPKCGEAAQAWRMGRGLLLCSACRAQTSVTAGTIFDGTRKPLRLWFIAAWEITSHKYGTNATIVRHVLGLNSYKTAWSWLHKLRRAMVRPGRDRLLGVVEVDEMYVGGNEKGVHGRQTEKKAIVGAWLISPATSCNGLSNGPWSRVPASSPTPLPPIRACPSWATITMPSTSLPRQAQPTSSCRLCTASRPC
jgi:hypothetical protein